MNLKKKIIFSQSANVLFNLIIANNSYKSL